MTLKGIRVVEIGQVISAPYAGMIFADLGAEVIKVEKPGNGDESRAMGPAFLEGSSMAFQELNRGKQSVVIDLKSVDGREQLFDLLEKADVLIHNLRPGESEHLHIDGLSMTERFPRLVYCEIGAFGHKGPRRLQPGYEPLLQAFAGLISMNGNANADPARIPASLVDQGTAMWVLIGALAALLRRAETGRGSIVNASLLETAIAWSSSRLLAHINEGRPSKRYGTGHPNLVPYQAFEASDGLLMICVGNDRLFAKFSVALGQEEWITDPRFATNRQRLIHRDQLIPAIEDILRTQPRQYWTPLFEATGIPAAPVHSIPEVALDTQVLAMEILRAVPEAGVVFTGLPLSFDKVRPPVNRIAPRLGADSDRILRGGSTKDPQQKGALNS